MDMDKSILFAIPAVIGGVAIGIVAGVRMQASGRFQHYNICPDLPQALFRREALLRGRVVSITDGDTFRFAHKPILPPVISWIMPKHLVAPAGTNLSDTTLQVRLAGIDAPEIAKFGNIGQPFGLESKAKLAEVLLNKTVTIKLLGRDQYSRAVAEVYVGLWPRESRNVSNKILETGLAVVYRQGGAVYGRKGEQRKLQLDKIETEAKERLLGIWSLGSNQETPAQYKARIKELL